MSEQPRNRQKPSEEGRPKTPKRQMGKESQAHIGELAIQRFLENPSAFWSFAPELANSIEQHLQTSSRKYKRVPVFEGYMTEREREFKLRSLGELIERYRSVGSLPSEETHRALALAAALREHAQAYKQTLLEMVERVMGLSLDSPTPVKLTIVKGKPEHHRFDLVRGVILSLAWDGVLLAVTLDPEEYQFRKRALSFVGMASDTESDVAENHDRYLWDVADGR